MEVTHSRVDVEACLANGQRPAEIVPRGQSEWLVSYDAIRMDQPLTWSRTVREDNVYIPLVPYNMLPQDLALAFMVQLGIRVSLDVGRPVARLHLATGFPLLPIYDDPNNPELETGWKYWLGFGIVLGP